jgi:hypothetical protein
MGMLSAGLHRLSFMVSVMLLDGLVGFRPRHRHPRGKRHRGWSVLLPCCGCSGDQWGPRAAPSGGKVVEPSFPSRRHEKLLGGVLDHGVEAPL